jgi:hypothetical protein
MKPPNKFCFFALKKAQRLLFLRLAVCALAAFALPAGRGGASLCFLNAMQGG